MWDCRRYFTPVRRRLRFGSQSLAKRTTNAHAICLLTSVSTFFRHVAFFLSRFWRKGWRHHSRTHTSKIIPQEIGPIAPSLGRVRATSITTLQEHWSSAFWHRDRMLFGVCAAGSSSFPVLAPGSYPRSIQRYPRLWRAVLRLVFGHMSRRLRHQ
jgi:hypothetical protein